MSLPSFPCRRRLGALPVGRGLAPHEPALREPVEQRHQRRTVEPDRRGEPRLREAGIGVGEFEHAVGRRRDVERAERDMQVAEDGDLREPQPESQQRVQRARARPRRLDARARGGYGGCRAASDGG